MKAPVKLLLSLIAFIFPCTFIVLFYPIVMKFLNHEVSEFGVVNMSSSLPWVDTVRPDDALSLQVRTAEGFWNRFKGLMLTAHLDPDHALLISQCASVHTCFMRYPIDIAFLDWRGRVVKLVAGLAPWRASFGGSDAEQVLEMAAGGIQRHALRLGKRPPMVLPDGLQESERV